MNYTQSANPNATNSELDAKRIIPFKQLTNSQRNELIGQYVDIIVDQMDRNALVEFVTGELGYRFESYSALELKEEVGNFDDGQYEELVNNVTS